MNISSCDAGGATRFCTVNLAVTGDPDVCVPNVSVIFRGKGRVLAAEQAGYHPRVKVVFQANAWCDRPIARNMAEDVLKPFVESEYDGHNWMLLCDNLDAQRTLGFKNDLLAMGGGGHILYGPPKKEI